MKALRHRSGGGSLRFGSVAAALVAGASLAWAHSWYPPECCDDSNCKPVERIEHVPDGGMVMHFGDQQVAIPAGYNVKPSQDMRAHVCVERAPTGEWKAICVFVPASS